MRIEIEKNRKTPLVRFTVHVPTGRQRFGFPGWLLDKRHLKRRQLLERLFIELEDALNSGQSLPESAWESLATLKEDYPKVHAKVVQKLGIQEPPAKDRLTVGKAFDDYIADHYTNRITISNWKQTRKKVVSRFPEDTPMEDISLKDMEKLFFQLREKYSVATLYKDVRNVRQLWDHCHDNGDLSQNIMRKLRFQAKSKQLVARKPYVDAAWFAAALEAITSQQQRTLLCYYRWMGARQNDPRGDKWEDVDWAGKRVLRSNIKDDLEKLGWCPIPPQMLVELEKWHQLVVNEHGKASGPIFPWLFQSSSANQYTYFVGRVKQKGVAVWDDFFNSLRASRAREIRRLPNGRQLEARWIGHSPEVADKHYDDIQESDYGLISDDQETPPDDEPGKQSDAA